MNKIKELRKEKNITVAELAKELGISQSMLTNYENGNGTPRDESIWEKLSQIFGVSKSHVMGLTTDIETANKTKKLKVVVDTSQPISIQPFSTLLVSTLFLRELSLSSINLPIL